MPQPGRLTRYSITLCTIIFIACFVWIQKVWVSIGDQSQIVQSSPYHNEINQIINQSQVLTRNRERRRTLRRVCGKLQERFYKNSGYFKPDYHRQQLIADHYHRVAFCEIYKVSSSSWMQFFAAIADKERADRDVWLTTHPGNWSPFRDTPKTRGLNQSGFIKLNTNDSSTNKYFKFLAVRHPLQRLVSAYMNRIVGRHINTTFEDFLRGAARYVHTDSHWMPFINTCDPCAVDFDVIVHLETVQEDLQIVCSKLNASYMVNEFPHHKPGSLNSQAYKAMYADIPKKVLQDVFAKFKPDADMFGYSFEGYGNSSQ